MNTKRFARAKNGETKTPRQARPLKQHEHLTPKLRDLVRGKSPAWIMALAQDLEHRAGALRRHIGQPCLPSQNPHLN